MSIVLVTAAEDSEWLTKGQEYEAIEHPRDESCYLVLCDDKCTVTGHYKTRFEEPAEVEFVTATKAENAPDEDNTNPKAANGLAKLPLHLWPGIATAYGAVGLYGGSLRYGRGNYKATPVVVSIYLSAMLRHLYAFIEGEEYDQVDGSPHLGAILANVAIILEARAKGTLVDDRPIQGGYLKEVEALTKITNSLQEMYKDRSPRHYTIADDKNGQEG